MAKQTLKSLLLKMIALAIIFIPITAPNAQTRPRRVNPEKTPTLTRPRNIRTQRVHDRIIRVEGWTISISCARRFSKMVKDYFDKRGVFLPE
jgi:hypothetical protein